MRRLRLHEEPSGSFSRRELMNLILPLILEQFLAVMVGMADTAMVSGVSGSAVAAVSTVDTVNLLFIQLFSAMSAGGAVVAAQYLGRKDQTNACAAARQLMMSTLFLSALIALLIAVFHRQVIALMDNGSDPDTVRLSCTYLLITAFSYPFLGVYNGGVGLLRAMGNSKASMWTSIAMNVINIGGNALLIHPCGLGVAGAAISTLISRMVSAAVILSIMFHDTMPIHLEKIRRGSGAYKPDFAMIRRILRVGVPNGLENSLFQVGKVLIMSIITTFPTAIRAANGICNSLSSVVNIPGGAIGLASVAVVGQLVGAGKKDEAKRYAKKLLLMMYVSILPLNLLLFLLPGPFVGLFSLEAEGVPAAVAVMRLYTLGSMGFWALSFGMPNFLRAAGDARFTMAVSIVSMLLLRVGMSYLLVYGAGLSLLGVWIAMHADWAARGVCFCVRFAGSRWLNKKVI